MEALAIPGLDFCPPCPEKPVKPQLIFTAQMIQTNRCLQKKSNADPLLTSLSSCGLLDLGLELFKKIFYLFFDGFMEMKRKFIRRA